MAKTKTIEGVLADNHYPSNIDNMARNDRPFEGSDSALPPSGTNPAIGADGKLSVKKIKKT